ncbi:MAG: hypothetical protein WBB48_12545 [Thermodesulfobacteriota bacterium]
MKKVLLVFSVLFLFSMTACDDNSRQGSISCKLMEIAETSDCLAKSLRRQCTYFGCEGSTIEIDVRPRECIFTDCETLECESIGINDGDLTEQPGLLMDLSVDVETGLPIGVFVADGFEEEVLCNLATIGN